MPRRSSFPARFVAIGILVIGSGVSAEAPEGYYRFPAVSGETVVFTAEGDLWTVGLDGGVARRLTTHPGEETDATISPDGRTVAFSATYEGPTEVYTMPLAGGLPTRRTWEAEPSVAVGWTPSGELVYRTERYSTLPEPRLVRLDLATGGRRQIPLVPAGDGAFDEAGALYFTRPADHRNNTKRYRGGTARDIWRFVEGGGEAVGLTTDFPGEDHSPMPWRGRVYFANDRDGTMNVWSMTPGGEDLLQHTRHSGWDVKSPALADGRIVYQLGADLWRLDLAGGEPRRLPIRLASDFDQLREKWVPDPLEYLTAFDFHPDGESVLVTTRGRVFVLPVEEGRRVRLARKPGVRHRDAVFMPGGDEVVLLSDESGEVELHLLPADGTGEGRALTADGSILRFGGVPSPDGRYVAYTDKNEDLWLLEVESGAQRRLNELREGIGEIAWSADGSWLAFGQRAANTYLQIILYRPADDTRVVLTSDRVNSRDPVFSPDGDWLYFFSDRHLRSLVGAPWGPRQPEAFFDDTFKLYQVALERGLRPPFRPRDELVRDDDDDAEEEEESRGSRRRRDGPPPSTEIDLDRLGERLYEVPAPPGNSSRLATDGKALFWLDHDPGSDRGARLVGFEIKPGEDEPVTLARGVLDFRLAGGKLLLRRREGFSVLDAEVPGSGGGRGGGEDRAGRPVDLEGWTFPISVREDFRQMFLDAWRLERDYFYDPGMHGVDWTAVRDKHLPLVDRVTTRAELSDLLGEVVAELSALHVSLRGGDHRQGPDDIPLATLGAQLARDPEAGGYRIERIYASDPDYPEWRSPLGDPYLEIAEGDVLLSIDGVPLLSVPDPGVLLRHKGGRQVLLEVRAAVGGAAREVIAVPTEDERALRYRDWQHSRRQRVEELGGGEIGYVHLTAMGRNNLSEWYRGFYPVFQRRGLIIDVRHNRGGNIDSLILEKLLRRAWFYWKGRVREPYWNMQYAFRGHMVVLVDERTASDGEAFAEGFRRLGLGQVIGKRTWGGEIWLSNNNRLSDGGFARAPQTGVYGPEGEWLIEGHGVEPDIVVDNLPHETWNGRDAQLEAAVAHLQRLIAAEPRDVPQPPPYPDKSFAYPARSPNDDPNP